jgi:hypothetical protein
MIGNRIKPRLSLAPRMSCASGTPIASVFLTEQKQRGNKIVSFQSGSVGNRPNERQNDGKQRDNACQYFDRESDAVVLPDSSLYGITEGRIDDEQDYSITEDVQYRAAGVDPFPNKWPARLCSSFKGLFSSVLRPDSKPHCEFLSITKLSEYMILTSPVFNRFDNPT